MLSKLTKTAKLILIFAALPILVAINISQINTVGAQGTCPTGQWINTCAANTCASKSDMDLFNNTDCDGHSQWIFEDTKARQPGWSDAQIIANCNLPTTFTPGATLTNGCNGCPAGSWSCSYQTRTTCADSATETRFNGTWLDGQSRWKREAAYLLGDISGNACGGTDSIRFANDIPPVDCSTLVTDQMSKAGLTDNTIRDTSVGFCNNCASTLMSNVVDKNTRCNNLTMALMGCINGNTADIERCRTSVELAAKVYGACEQAQLANCDLKQNDALTCLAQKVGSSSYPAASTTCYNLFVQAEINKPQGRCNSDQVYCSQCDECVSKSVISCDVGCGSRALRINQYASQIPNFASCVQNVGQDQLSRCLTEVGGSTSSTGDNPDDGNCMKCLCSGNTWTGIGCVTTSSTSGIVVSILRIVLGIIGGIFLLLMISAGYLYNTQKQENIELAKKRITAMFGALIFITFSVLLLRVIGVNILDVTTLGILG